MLKHFTRMKHAIIHFVINNFWPGQWLYLSKKEMLQYWVIQRILRVNSEVPWPVHWSSIVVCHEKIRLSSNIRPPGYLPGQYIQAINGIEIGTNVWFAPGVKIISSNHEQDDYSKHSKTTPIIIGDNCWIGANVVILPGVILGKHVIVGAGSIVTKSFGSDCVVAGVPARMIKTLDVYQS